MRKIAPFLLGLFYVLPVLADSGDVLNFVLGTNYEHDSNLFRLADGVQPAGKGAERSDNVLKTNVGIKIDKKYSLQRFKIDYAHEEVKYDNAKFLEFKSNNYKATWLWAITPSMRGNLAASRTVDLVPYLDFKNSNIQNLRTKEIQNFDFDWSPHNVWHLLGGYSKINVLNSQTFLPETSFKLDIAEAGVRYTADSGSFVTLKLRNRNGENQATNFAAFVGKQFTEREEELSVFWILTGKSRLSSNFGHVKRIDEDFAIRDFSDYFGGVNYAWDVTSKINLTIDLSRKVSAYLDNNSSFTVNDSLSIRPTWTITPKILLSANALVGKRKFQGNGPNIGLTNDPLSSDAYSIYGVSAAWVPRNAIRIGLNLQHEDRNSNVISRDYSTDVASISGQLTF